MLLREGAAALTELSSQIWIWRNVSTALGELVAALRLHQQRATGACQDLTGFAAHGADDRSAGGQHLEELGGHEGLEQGHIAKRDQAHVGGGVQGGHLVLGHARAHDDVCQVAPIALRDQAIAVGTVADEQEGHVGLGGSGIEDNIQPMRQSVGTDVRDDELSVQAQGLARLVRVAGGGGREEARVGAVGDHGQLGARNALAREAVGEGLGDNHDARGLAVQEVCQALEELDGHAAAPHQSEIDDGLGPQVADLQDEGDASHARDEPRRQRGEQRRGGGDDHVRSLDARQAEQHGGEHEREVVEAAATHTAVGHGVQPAAQDADAVERLGGPCLVVVGGWDAAEGVIGKSGEHVDGVAGADPGAGELVDARGGRGRLGDEVVAHIRDVHRAACFPESGPRRPSAGTGSATRPRPAAPCGPTPPRRTSYASRGRQSLGPAGTRRRGARLR